MDNPEASLRSTMIGDYSAIGFGKSLTEAFSDLRAEQDRIVNCLKATVRTFRRLKAKEGEEDEDDEDEEFKDLSDSVATSRYCEDRERLLDSLRQWVFDSAYQIGENFVDSGKDAERIQRILDFVNKAKMMLRKTSPLGRQKQEREKDEQFLATFTTPEEMLEMGRVVKKHMEEQARILDESRITPKTGGRRAVGASTMMSGIKCGYSLRSLKKKENGSASSTPGNDGMAPQGSSTPDTNYGKTKSKREKYAKEKKGNKMAAFKLDEAVGKKKTATEEVVVTESESEEEDGAAVSSVGERTKAHLTINELENQGVIVDDDVIIHKLAEERQRLKEETEARERQEEEERAHMEEMKRKEEEEEERKSNLSRLQKMREEKEASDAKSRELRKEIAAMEKRTKEEQRKREESKNRLEERKKAEKRKEEAEKKRIVELSKKEAARRKKEEEEEEEREEEEEGEEEEEKEWIPVVKKKKKTSSDSDESPKKTKKEMKRKDSEEEGKGRGGGGAEAYWGIHQETLARQRMIDARPKSEEEKYGDDGRITYMAFKRKFKAITNVRGINHLDILNEIFYWLRGSPKTMAEPFKEIEDPEEAMEAIWENLDGLYALKRMTAEERMKKIMKRPAVSSNDIDSVVGMLAALKGVWYEAKSTKSENGLNKDEIIQDLLNEKLGFMAESFYKKQYKIMKSEPMYRRGFFDIIEDLQEKAQIMKSRGLTSKPTTGKEKGVVKMAPAQVTNGPKTFSDAVAKSPTKTQQPLPEKAKCEFCSKNHWSEECPSLLELKTVMERREMAKKKGLCFRCMKREKHIALNCTAETPKCKICTKPHKTCFHSDKKQESTTSEQTLSSTSSSTPSSASSSTGSSNGSGSSTAPTSASSGESAKA